tara:strand:+ start:1862 stop:2662 length:801 start_codon:yes stop_codon:yes gene_type:complete
MSTFLSRVSTSGNPAPLRAIIYGQPGDGKTTCAAKAPNPIFMDLEGGLGIVSADVLPTPISYEEVTEQVKELLNAEHEYRTLVIDAIDAVEPLIWQATCDEHLKKHIQDFPYSTGYVRADAYWIRFLQLLDALRARRNMNIILISHAQAAHYDDPTVGTYTRWEPNLHKRANALLLKWSDMIGFFNQEKVAMDKGDTSSNRSVRTSRHTGSRVLSFESDGSFVAKNRHGIKGSIAVSEDAGWQAVTEALKSAWAARAKTTNKEKAA